jgi:hypothetical protein
MTSSRQPAVPQAAAAWTMMQVASATTVWFSMTTV